MKIFRNWLSRVRGREHDDPLVTWPKWLRTLGHDRSPDFDIGPGYLQRWWILPRNPLFNVYLHRVLRDDDDRALHDHPWLNCSIILRGVYREVVPLLDDAPTPYVRIYGLPTEIRRRGAGSVVFRRATAAHRLVVERGPVWTLFITGPILRDWGFHCKRGWVHWRDFTAPGDKARVGRGCD